MEGSGKAAAERLLAVFHPAPEDTRERRRRKRILLELLIQVKASASLGSQIAAHLRL
jgi:hypothetical protein